MLRLLGHAQAAKCFYLARGARLFVRRYSANPTFVAPRLPGAVQLRPYQETCLQACLETLRDKDSTRIGISLPTGSGKTTVFVSLISMLQPPPSSPNAVRALIIVNSVELARQAAEQVGRMFPELSVEIDQGTKHKASGLADVTVATYQSLLRNTRLEKFDPNRLKCIIVDEAHHAAAPSYRKILSHFDPNIRNPDVDFVAPKLPHAIPIIGFSATFSRHDGLALGSVFQRIVYHRDFLEMIKEQWLCNVRFTSVKAKLNLSEVTINTRSGEFNPTSLAHVVNTETVNKLVVNSWLDLAASRRSTLVFCVNLAHLRELTNTFREAGIDARYVYANTPANERKALVEAFKAGKFPVLLNVAILTEGADIPNIDCVVVAKPTRSRNVFAQMIGRGMRLSPATGKEDCHIIDFVDSTNRVPGIVSTPTLFGLNPDEIIDGQTPEELEKRAAALIGEADKFDSDDVPDPGSITYIDYDNPFDLVQDASGAPHITKISRFAWVGCGGDVYVLECMGKGYIKIQPDVDEDGEEMLSAHYVEPIPEWELQGRFQRSRFRRPRLVLTARTLDEAVRGCDKYATTKILRGNLALGLHRTANWRKGPASSSQTTMLKKRLNTSKGGDKLGQSIDVDNLTKGQAANLITRLKHGAQVRNQEVHFHC
ncbi:P-loop containing nucleoside triphosphate hydrolase protein [Fomitiporia mediterranea MF3/22]|uniref:P-loop containing nucleoside triphosphate hydrolase protein n=1 Tax=Fomitiporia mediterranea (strain MF3/22) TaxID=694068 RepID=UPI00044076B7|nr:P-loop containing nucleoside triphosphate hydrolase protein [Fomitiporia mediterranea MF3/22]EJD04075.1 P-loop containing nucleoside triphosphate hydrolase protein [Fomitiporia mediterranea MF3/22]